MSFFSSVLDKHNLTKHDGRPLWGYLLNATELNDLRKTLQFATHLDIDPRDVALYYSEWWKKNYNGGIPSKQTIYESIGGNSRFVFNSNDFFVLATKGAQILNIKWIKKQNVLRFKTLLLQGGLPLKHISQNQGRYKVFLEAVLEEQPETIEDFIFKTHITSLLPKSSQNDTVYENCLEIVKSILNNDGHYDELLASEESLKAITNSLKIRSNTLTRKVKQSKPKNYWLINLKNNECKISLRLGLANTYTKDTLTEIIGVDAIERSYQFFMDDDLICVFRKMGNGEFKTVWHNKENKDWDVFGGLPNTYVISNDSKIELPDFIQTIPNLAEPSLWTRFNDNEWRLIKGCGAPNKEAALLFPNLWKCDLTSSNISLYKEKLSWLLFEGEIEIQLENEKRTYKSDVKSFDWIIESKKPKWMLKSNLPVVQGVPNILVFDDEGYDIKRNRFKLFYKKHNSKDSWEVISTRLRYIPAGCFDLRIEKDGLIAHDVFFNIGNLQTRYSNQSIHSAKIEFRNLDYFECKLNESKLLQIEKDNNYYTLNVNTEHNIIPVLIKGSIGYPNKRNLFFDLISPFQGMVITDKNGQIINEDKSLSLADLYGMRILSTINNKPLLKISNSLKNDVKIIKEIKESIQPVISFKDEILRLFYLADAMYHKNTVCLELSEGKNKKIYEISGFTHDLLNVDYELNKAICINNFSDDIELFAIPINCMADDIEVIPLSRNELSYDIPKFYICKQFIIISSDQDGKQLRPRFVNTGDVLLGTDKNERIENYHTELSITGFYDDLWKQVMYYFHICLQFEIPFSTFDQLRAISRSQEVASRAFFFLVPNIFDSDNYLQKSIPETERDLGFCFHWISKNKWIKAFTEITDLKNNHLKYSELLSAYLQDNGLVELNQFINGNSLKESRISQSDIYELRSQLGESVLNELPYHSPMITDNYNIPIKDHNQVRLLLQSPIAVAESISDTQKSNSIWAGDEKREVIRRNIQYSQFLCAKYPKTDFYNKTILHVLKRS